MNSPAVASSPNGSVIKVFTLVFCIGIGIATAIAFILFLVASDRAFKNREDVAVPNLVTVLGSEIPPSWSLDPGGIIVLLLGVPLTVALCAAAAVALRSRS
ncbi:hypothetical protein [Microlunatus speluncae]|uniref:hypothetical protein n=1 Tax=Microlunatus speluncae TaxID=2594267 RepID=UPI0012662B39|nr:hypothetical protein [Microlunatus speluncae]